MNLLGDQNLYVERANIQEGVDFPLDESQVVVVFGDPEEDPLVFLLFQEKINFFVDILELQFVLQKIALLSPKYFLRLLQVL